MDLREPLVSQSKDLVSSRSPETEPVNQSTRTKLDEVVEAGLNIFGGRVIK